MTHDDDFRDSFPHHVADLADMALCGVKEATGVEPDFSPETLPLVDQYLRELPDEAPREVRDLVVAGAGCYFGEVVRRRLGGRWAALEADPRHWRVELEACFLHFSPVGMTGEVMAGGDTDRYDGTFSTLDALWDGLSEALAAAAPLPEDEYYSLAGRVDVLELAADWLTGVALAQADGGPVRRYTAEDYEVVLAGGSLYDNSN